MRIRSSPPKVVSRFLLFQGAFACLYGLAGYIFPRLVIVFLVLDYIPGVKKRFIVFPFLLQRVAIYEPTLCIWMYDKNNGM